MILLWCFLLLQSELLELSPHGSNEEREVARGVQVFHQTVERGHVFVAFVHWKIGNKKSNEHESLVMRMSHIHTHKQESKHDGRRQRTEIAIRDGVDTDPELKDAGRLVRVDLGKADDDLVGLHGENNSIELISDHAIWTHEQVQD